MLTACSDDDIDRVYTVGEADNAIVLRAGVNEGGSGVETRVRDDNHANHLVFKKDTKIALRIDGTWTGHSPEAISQQTIATVGDVAANTDDRHNKLSAYNPVRYWDDYGTADPANVGTPENPKGRETGLTIYGIGVDGVTTAPNMEANDSWTNFSWSVCSSDEANGTATPKVIDQATNGWANYDLLTSNNIHVEETNMDYDGTYKFDDYLSDKNNDTNKSSNILEFTHAMTKITVQLTAGEGFPITDGKAHFENDPTVTLEGFYYKGSVNVEDKISTHSNDVDKANIKMHLNGGGTAHTATFDALVFPGNAFENTNPILTFTADGNTLHVTAAKLNEAIEAAITNKEKTKYPGTNKTLLQAWNYLLKITVKKTDLDIEATILDWNEVVAEEEAPKIDVDKAYGHPTQDGHPDFTKSFDLYRSTSITGSYLGTGDHAVVSCADSKYTMSPQLYWPNHSTHYFFRGVWPLVGSTDDGGQQLGPTSAQIKTNTIDVTNTAYKKGYYPSDLMIGRPLLDDDKTPDETCKVHTSSVTQGICATEGKVHINFRYVMSQVEVELKTVSGDAAVNIDENTKVELVNVADNGTVNLSDCAITATMSTGSYTLDNVAGDGNELLRHSAIVPQTLTFTEAGASSNVRFKITVTNTDATTDIYYADINPILKSDKSDKVAPNGKWESGVHYKYTLTLSKTAINVTATLTDWVEVTAKDEVWF